MAVECYECGQINADVCFDCGADLPTTREAVDIDEIVKEEKASSFEIGKVGLLENLAEEFHERAGEQYAKQNDKRARFFRDLGDEFESRGKKKRERWNEKYKENENE